MSMVQLSDKKILEKIQTNIHWMKTKIHKVEKWLKDRQKWKQKEIRSWPYGVEISLNRDSVMVPSACITNIGNLQWKENFP